MTTTESPLSVSFKATTGYDSPMLTVRADTLPQLAAQIGGISEQAREAAGNNDILLAINLAAAEFAGKAGATNLTKPAQAQAQQPANNDPWAPGPNPGQAQGQAQAQSYNNQAPAQRSYGAGSTDPSPIPLGDKSGRPMTYRSGLNKNGQEYWAWMDGQGRNTPPNQKDKTIWLDGPLPAGHPGLNQGR